MLSRKRRTWECQVFLTSPGFVLLLDNFTLLFIHQLTVVIHFQALVRMKALQDRCVTEEGVISSLRKRNETLTNEHDQYKDALRTLNKEVTGRGSLKGKLTGRTTIFLRKHQSPLGEKQPKKPSPPKPSHGIGKCLMTALGPVTQRTCHLLLHKGYAEMVESIIKEMEVDPCAK